MTAATAAKPLTPRELEVLRLAARGFEDAEIAAALFLSVTTVKTHLRRTFAKLKARDRVHAVSLGYEAGLLVTVAAELLAQARELLLAVPRCERHPTIAPLVGECYACTTWHRSRRVEADAGLLLGGRRG